MGSVTDATFSFVELHQGLAVVKFGAEWCGPCRALEPILAALNEAYIDTTAIFLTLDVDSSPETPKRFGVRAVPTLLFFKDGKHVDTLVGLKTQKELDEKVQQHLLPE